MFMYTIYHSKGRTEIFIMNKIPFAQQINHSKCKNKDIDETVDLFCFCNFNRFELSQRLINGEPNHWLQTNHEHC